MLKTGNFSVVFRVDNVPFREEYELAYRTEEEHVNSSTLYQQAKAKIAKDLNILRCQVTIDRIMEIHNHLIIEEE